jgi:nitroreductase
MELKKVIENRASVRTFKNEEIPLTDLKEMIRLASLAPSANNYQPWKFIVVRNKEVLNKLAIKVSAKIAELPENQSKASKNVKSQVEWFATFFQDAPVLVALAMEEYETVLEKGVTLSHEEINRQRNFPDIQSAGACIQNLLLSAVDMGYGACWLSAPMIAKQDIESILKIKEPFHLIAFVAVGKPDRPMVPKEKKPVDDIIEWID